MKNLKFTLIIIAFLGFISTSQAQEGGLSLGAEFALPLGDFSDAAGVGIGGSLQYEHPVADKLGLLVSAGYTYLTTDNDWIKSTALIPIQAGIRFYPDVVGSGMFLGVQTGVHIYSLTTEEFDVPLIGTFESETTSDPFFSVAPEVGFFLADDFSLALRYQLIFVEDVVEFDDDEGMIQSDASNFGYLGLRMAFHF